MKEIKEGMPMTEVAILLNQSFKEIENLKCDINELQIETKKIQLVYGICVIAILTLLGIFL